MRPLNIFQITNDFIFHVIIAKGWLEKYWFQLVLNDSRDVHINIIKSKKTPNLRFMTAHWALCTPHLHSAELGNVWAMTAGWMIGWFWLWKLQNSQSLIFVRWKFSMNVRNEFNGLDNNVWVNKQYYRGVLQETQDTEVQRVWIQFPLHFKPCGYWEYKVLGEEKILRWTQAFCLLGIQECHHLPNAVLTNGGLSRFT